MKTCGSQWRGVGPQIRGPFPLPAFSIKPQHTGNNLWTWPSNSPAPVLSPEPNLSHPPTTSNHSPKYPADPLTCSPYRIPTRSTFWSHMQNYKCNMYVGKCKHTHPPALTHRGPVFSLRGQWLFFSTGSKVTHKKIQYSKCTGSPAYQYIIQKGDRWRAIRRWKAIEFSVSPYLQMHQSAAVDNWIKKETWLTSSSKKLKLPAIWCLEPLIAFFGSKNYLWHLHSSASCLHFN